MAKVEIITAGFSPQEGVTIYRPPIYFNAFYSIGNIRAVKKGRGKETLPLIFAGKRHEWLNGQSIHLEIFESEGER